MSRFLNLFFIFFIYSFIGWITETIYVSIRQKKVANRGFLIGPYCPIYGISATTMLLTLSKYKNDVLILFIMGVVIASFLEYLTSLVLEKIFRVRWWDYSNRILNIDGRVCLLNSILFGFCCVLLLTYLNPFIESVIYHIPLNVKNITALILFILFSIDVFFSFKIIHDIKIEVNYNLRKDYTEEISSKVRETLINESRLFKRILTAFPNFNIINKVIK